MSVKTIIDRDEFVIEPYTSIGSIERELLEREYVVIKDEDKFIGLLTVSDVVKHGHHLAIDCYTERPFLNADDQIDNAISIMNTYRSTVLPVRDNNNKYMGSITEKRIFGEIIERLRNTVTIEITNVVGDQDLENAKQTFLTDMYHNTKNPIQVIYSSIHILKTSPSEIEKESLFDSIQKSVKQIDILINTLFQEYFHKTKK